MDNLKDLEGMQIVVKEFRTISKASRDVLLRMLVKEHDLLGEGVEVFNSLRQQWIEFGRPQDQKIPFIKKVREVAKDIPGQPYFGLKEAKDLVESW